MPANAGSRLASITKPVVVGALIALCCWISIHTRLPGGLSTLWIASGVLTGVLLTSERSTWLGCVLAAFVGNVAIRAGHGDAWYSALGLGFASTLDAFLVALALVLYVGEVTEPAKVKRVAAVAVASTLVACALSGAIAASVLAGFGGSSFASMFAEWYPSHTLGMAICATLTVVMRAQGLRLLGRPGHRFALALSVALTAATCLAVFSQSRYPLLFLVYPPVLYGTFRHRFLGVAYGMTLVTGIAIAETIAGNGPFYLIPNAGMIERTLLLQVFITSTCMLALPIAVVLSQRRFLERRLREGELLYRTLADHSSDLVMRIGKDGRQQYVSPSVKDMLGWEQCELTGRYIDLVHPDDTSAVVLALETLYATGASSTITYRARHKDGRCIWIEAHVQIVPSVENGDQREIIYSGRDVTRRVEMEAMLVQLARHDVLTGLANRLHFNESAELALARHRRNMRPLALLYLDIDRFKQINDSFGHAAGDSVLTEFALRLKGCLRVTDFAARLGGDEFVVLVEDVDTPEVPEFIARKMITALQPAIVVDGRELHVTTSVGVAFCRRIASSRDELLHAADKALYTAKAAGRDRYCTAIVDEATAS